MEPQSAPGLLFAGCIELLHLWLQKKIRNTKGTFLAKMGTIKDRNGMDLMLLQLLLSHFSRV